VSHSDQRICTGIEQMLALTLLDPLTSTMIHFSGR
jgi:hypothetical protein